MADEGIGRGELAPFQIKAFSVAVRKRIVAAATNDEMTVGEWMERAAMNQLEREKNQLVLPPPTVAASPQRQFPAPPASVMPFDFAGLAQLLGALGTHAPDALRRDAVASTRAVLRQARGLPPLRSSRRPTRLAAPDVDDPAP